MLGSAARLMRGQPGCCAGRWGSCRKSCRRPHSACWHPSGPMQYPPSATRLPQVPPPSPLTLPYPPQHHKHTQGTKKGHAHTHSHGEKEGVCTHARARTHARGEEFGGGGGGEQQDPISVQMARKPLKQCTLAPLCRADGRGK